MSEDVRELIGKRIMQLREDQGYTQAELAAKLGVTEAEVGKIEEGIFSMELPHFLASLLLILENSLLKRWSEHKDRLYLR